MLNIALRKQTLRKQVFKNVFILQKPSVIWLLMQLIITRQKEDNSVFVKREEG